MAKGRANRHYKNGLRAGWTEYRYGSPRKPVSLPRIFKGQARKSRIGEVMDTLRDWRFSQFEGEGPAVAGIRSALCLDGHGWPQSNAEAVSLVFEALKLLGAKRPSWLEGQKEYTTPREQCRRCGADVPEELRRDAISIKFCSDVCARAAYQDSGDRMAARDHGLYAAAKNIIMRTGNPMRACRQCGDPFRPVFPTAEFCSVQCQGKSRRQLTKRACRHCGDPFQPKHGGVIYCSQACGYAAKRTRPDVECRQCGKTFRPSKRPAEGRGVFCSRACHQASLAVRLDKQCIWCGTPFVAERENKQYCSGSCATMRQSFLRGAWKPKTISPPVFDHVFEMAA